MSKNRTDNIKVEIIGVISEEIKKTYAKKLATILMKQYDKEFCEKIANQLSLDSKINS